MAIFKSKKESGDALWTKCEKCESMMYKKKFKENLEVCPECGWHYRINTTKRLEHLVDDGTFQELFTDLESVDILSFKAKKSYKDKLVKAVKAAGRNDSATFGRAMIHGIPCIFGVIDPTFIMGSMGSVCGEKIARGAEKALEDGVPLVIISGSGGGARMEEGVNSLMQMAKVSAAIGRLQNAGGFYVIVQTNATMGGSMASFATLGDIILAEPMALLGFTGPRVVKQTIKKELPPGFQTSEFLLNHGFIDMVVHRIDLKAKLAEVMKFFTIKTPRELAEEDGEKVNINMETSELIAQHFKEDGETSPQQNTGETQTASQVLASFEAPEKPDDD